ncbi:uncharacterized protein LOC132545870 [Ylistrum balloti]|uniref:uncharacterized protein LOC132545870 n=1 Tax=Ylistrum balloti TaxID=509963 RepID=UPI002905ADE1|nr:uncharacterized protein LOC132545870 [Ylistrum balloti]
MVRLRDTKIYKVLATGCLSEVSSECIKHVQSGKNINLRDEDTGETYLHLLADNVDRFRSPQGTCIIYIMASKGIDLDLLDNEGNSFLHRIMRMPYTYRAVVAMIRCGADPLVNNKEGLTPRDILMQTKPDGWEETLHWFTKFTPGLYRALMEEHPDRALVEKLLKYLCRTNIVKDGKLVCLKTIAKQNNKDLYLVDLLEKYENTIEFALSLFTGKDLALQHFFKEVSNRMDTIDINVTDYSYQYRYPDYPEVPLPVLAALWEGDMEDNIAVLLGMGVDTSVLFSYNPEVEPPKPLFFQVLCGVVKPTDSIIHRVLEASDLSVRNLYGQTIVYEAITQDYPENLIISLFKYGANLASRDKHGRTAHDYAELIKKPRYCRLIDTCVVEMVKECNVEGVEDLLRHGYDHILDVTDRQTGNSIIDIARGRSSTISELLKKAGAVKEHIRKMFQKTETGSLGELRRLLGRKYATSVDRCGRTVLHIAIFNGKRDIISYLATHYSQLLNIQDNLGRTPLHYAQLFMEGDQLLSTITKLGNTSIRDVQGLTPLQYSIKECGERTFSLLKKAVQEMAMDVFLSQTQFKQSMKTAIQKEDLTKIQRLLRGLRVHGDITRHSTLLFSCIEWGKENAAIQMIREGLSTDIFKQYQKCDPNSTKCVMYECTHTMISLREKAEELKRRRVLQFLDQIQMDTDKNEVMSPRATPDVSNFEKFGKV